MVAQPRKVDRQRWQRLIVELLADFARQYAALESAMGAFGENFALGPFKQAFDTADDMEAYNHVQAVERALGRVQNYVADLAQAGVKLAELPLPPMEDGGSFAQQAFESLRDAGVLSTPLYRRLTQAQKARTTIEHSYVGVPAGRVHRATLLVHETSREFISRYRDWIEPHVTEALGDSEASSAADLVIKNRRKRR